MKFGIFGRNTFSSYSKVQLFFLLQFLLTPIFSIRTGDLTVPVKRNFIVPKDVAVKAINRLQKPALIDYIPLLSKKVATVVSSPLAPTVSSDTFSFFSNDTSEAADIVRETAKSSSGPEEAIDKLVQVEKFIDEFKKSTLPIGKEMLCSVSTFMRNFKFENGSFLYDESKTSTYKIKATNFIDHLTVYSPYTDIDILIDKAIAETNSKSSYNGKTVETFFLERLLLQLQWPGTNKEVPLRVLIDKILELKIASDKIYKGKLGGVPMSPFSSEKLNSFLDSKDASFRLYVLFVEDFTLAAFKDISEIPSLKKFSTPEEQLSYIFANLDSVLNECVVIMAQKNNVKTIPRRLFNYIFQNAFPATASITEDGIPDELCLIGELPCFPTSYDDINDYDDDDDYPELTLVYIEAYLLYLIEEGKFSNVKSLTIESFFKILRDNLSEFKEEIEKKIIEESQTSSTNYGKNYSTSKRTNPVLDNKSKQRTQMIGGNSVSREQNNLKLNDGINESANWKYEFNPSSQNQSTSSSRKSTTVIVIIVVSVIGIGIGTGVGYAIYRVRVKNRSRF